MPIFRRKPLAVVGGGDSAVEEATFLTKYASKVYLLVRRDKLRASAVMQKRLMSNPKVRRPSPTTTSVPSAATDNYSVFASRPLATDE